MEEIETDHDKAISYYKDGKYDLFLPIAEKLFKEEKVSEFLCQALSNIYFTNKEYEKALNVNTTCIASFQDKSNLDNRLKILEKLGTSYDDERGTTLIRLFTMTAENSYIQSYISLKIVSPSSFLTIYELVHKIKPMFFTNIIHMLFTRQPYGLLLYGKKLLAKALDLEETENGNENEDTIDYRIIERCKKSSNADEKYVCILYLILPQLFYTSEEIEKAYRRIMTNLEKIQTISVEMSSNFILSNLTYYYTYFGYNIRSMHQLFSSFLRKNYVSMFSTSPKSNPQTIIKRDRIRIGFFSNLIFKNHSVCRDRLGIVKYLCNDPIFDVFLIRYKNTDKDLLHRNIMKDTPFTDVQLGFDKTIDEQQILDLSLDILVYPEIGMDTNVYLMAYTRFAPIQINTWGHSETSGFDNIDYYISSEYFEDTDKAQEYYSEKLIQMKSLSSYYYNLNILFNNFTTPIESLKTQYQLFPSFQLYGIFQSTFKYHPTLMTMIRDILEKNQRAFFVLLIDQESWKEFMDYAEKMIGHNVNRIKMMNKMDTLQYCNLLRCMDIMIDSYPFGGCNTSLDSFHFNKIVLTLPGNKLNGRFTLGFYKKMNIMEPVCESPDDLVDKAIYYMKDKEARKAIEDKISDRKHLLFQEQESLLEWNNQMRALANVEPRKARTRTFVLQNKLETYPENARKILREEHVVSLPLTMQLNDTVVWVPPEFTASQLLEWIEILNMKNNEPECIDIAVSNVISSQNSVRIHMVLARYNEDISFLKMYYFSSTTIYNKGPSSIDNAKSLPNVGKCDHTYLTHIINNYDRLDDVTVFLPACFYNNLKKRVLTYHFLQKVYMMGKTCFVGKKVVDAKKDLPYLYSFQIDRWESSLPENKDGTSPKCEPSEIRPYGKWLEKVFKVNNAINLNQTFVTYYGILAVRKEDIRRRPISFYKKLLSFVKTPNPEAGHYIERSWDLIFKAVDPEYIYF
jgi:predicted O-linked N-acetylglucosamine transferase (SPINDLY family)